MNIVGIIQARISSTRLPGKILADLCGKPMLLQTVERIRNSKLINKVVIATSDLPDDDVVEKFAFEYHINLFRGNLLDVLERFYFCAKKENADIVVRFTGDNPLVDARVIDEGIEFFLSHKEYDYIKYRNGLPVGTAIEIFTFKALEKSYLEATDQECREHVTPYIYKNPSLFNFYTCETVGEDYSELRWTVDTNADYLLIKTVYECLYEKDNNFGFKDILEEYKKHPEWVNINNTIQQKKVRYKGV